MKFLEFNSVLIRFNTIKEISFVTLRDFNPSYTKYGIYIRTSYKRKYEEIFKDKESANERFQEIMGILKAKIQKGVKNENTQHSQ